MKELFTLFWTFCKIGGLTFGGGYAMLPMIQKEIVENKKWATDEEVMNYYAVGQCTPGVIAVNTASFIGYKIKGIPGAVFATVGVVFPSLLIIMTIAFFLQNFAELTIVKEAFAAVRVAVLVLVIEAILKLKKSALLDRRCIFIFAVVFLMAAVFKISPIYITIAAFLFGIFLKKMDQRKGVDIK